MGTLVFLGVLVVFGVVVYNMFFKKIKSYPPTETTNIVGGGSVVGGEDVNGKKDKFSNMEK